MNKYISKLLLYSIILLMGLGSCKKAYAPPTSLKTDYASVLVVEGFINSGVGTTKFVLSKASQLENKTTFIPEKNATVSVESDQGKSENLIQNGDGIYEKPLTIISSQKYRLRVKTAAGKEYLSDYVEVKATPDIDSITWRESTDGVEILADTHDDRNNSKYYRWDYEESWMFNANYDSEFIYKNNVMLARSPQESVYRCWANNNSTSIILGSTVKLTSDIIDDQFIATIPSYSEKLGIRYSILVKQYTLSKAAYEYFEVMKKNTEELGSIFGPLPSQQNGNIKNIKDEKEPVVGFIYATSQKEKRIFIDNKDISYVWPIKKPNSDVCLESEIMQTTNLTTYFASGALVPTYGIYDPSGSAIIGYGYAPRICVDCTLRGTKQKPSFWQ